MIHLFYRTRRGSITSIGSSTSLFPKTNIKEIGSKVRKILIVLQCQYNDLFEKLGKSLLNLATIFTGKETNEVERAKPQPKDTPIMPRRPPRRKLCLDRSRHKSLTGGEHQGKVEETIAEVESPSDSPVVERGPKVRMPGEVPVLSLSSPGARKPSVPQPGQPRVPSPSSTVNTLELIGSPVSSRPRVQQPRAGALSPALSPAATNRIPKYENTVGAKEEPTVAMPGTPSQTVKVMAVWQSRGLDYKGYRH